MHFIYCYICALDLPSIFKNETGKQRLSGSKDQIVSCKEVRYVQNIHSPS